jgi:hypothetical protein
MDPDVYGQAHAAAEVLRAYLSEMIVGRRMEASSCSCGSCGVGSEGSVAIGIKPAYKEFGYQEHEIGLWYFWSVRMRARDSKRPPGEHDFSVALNRFIDIETIESMFRERFRGVDVQVDGLPAPAPQ